MADLPPGPYVLTVTAHPRNEDVAAASRQVHFTVVAAPTVSAMTPSASSTAAVGPCCAVKGSYEAAARAFAHGDRTAAAVAIVRAPLSQLQHALSSIDARDAGLLEAASAMHLVLAARAMEAERYEEMLLQLAISDAIFKRIRFPEEDPQFASNWYIASAVMQLNAVDIDAAKALAERGITAKVAPADMRLSEGIVHETAAYLESRQNGSACASCPNTTLFRGYARRMARMRTAPEWSDQRQRTVELNEAEDAYRQSLEADATTEEARLRLGRTLLLEGKSREARAELERVVNATRDARLSYLAHLFLADLSERAADNDGAVREYSAALAIDSSSREAYVGLSNLALRAGDDRRARDYIQQWTTRPAATVVDPWIAYQRGLDQLEPALQTLLRIISQ
jgi:tetratricopeptide (TPR) repeat protein